MSSPLQRLKNCELFFVVDEDAAEEVIDSKPSKSGCVGVRLDTCHGDEINPVQFDRHSNCMRAEADSHEGSSYPRIRFSRARFNARTRTTVSRNA